MKEINDIIRAYDEAQLQGRSTALATVVHVDGSSYRRPGARMLVTEDGRLTGAISGGCLEGDALRKALYVMSRQQSMLVTYDTMDEDDAKFGIGLGCNGIIQVLIEPLDASNPQNAIALLKMIAAKREEAVLVTLFSLANRHEKQEGTCLVYKKNTAVVAAGIEPLLEATLRKDAAIATAEHASAFRNYVSLTQNSTAFIEFIEPAISLVVIGGGNDVQPLVKMADIMGWQTTVIDGRASHARSDRFIPGCRVLLSKPEAVLEKLTLDSRTVFMLMTHNYNYDLAMLRSLAAKEIPYIGSLGPKKKLERMLDDLREAGVDTDNLRLDHVYGPAGLDIGAETPEEIALSILAEIKAVLSGKSAPSLRHTAVIHARPATHIEQVYIQKTDH